MKALDKNILLTRDQFRNAVFERDGYKCVICGEKAVMDKNNEPTNLDAHHIIERRLFSDGGYYLSNGASVCEPCHIDCERTVISCDVVRNACGITRIILPDHMYDDQEYDKWGNIILPNGNRLKGDLFYDESVQKVLSEGGVLDFFDKYWKYPRSYHLPWSNLLKDDRMMKDDTSFIGKRVIATLKLDGENSTLYRDHYHARSINSGPHETRDWVKGLWARISYLIDDDMRICGENMYAVHSVKYDDLKSYFYAFSIWVDNKCLSWDDTTDYCAILGLDTVPVIYDGIYDKEAIIDCFKPHELKNEGYVIRIADEFTYSDFRRSLGKFVRPEFRQIVNSSHGHWISKKVEKNILNHDNK